MALVTTTMMTRLGASRLTLKASSGHWMLIQAQMQTTLGPVEWPCCCACSERALVMWLKLCWPMSHICRCVAVCLQWCKLGVSKV